MELLPIRSANQIQDAIEGMPPSTALDTKIQTVRENISAITRVNGSKVFAVEIDRSDIIYSLRPHAKPRYHYPIQYARIEISPIT